MDPKMKSFLLNVGSTTSAMKATDPWVEEDLLRASLFGSADDLRRWLRRKTSVLTQRTERFIRRRAGDHCECCHRPISWMARCENGGTFGLINPDARWLLPNVVVLCRACAGLWPSRAKES